MPPSDIPIDVDTSSSNQTPLDALSVETRNHDCPLDREKKETATVGKLQEFLGIIDRWDVFEDIQENLARDTAKYKEKLENLEQAAALEQNKRASSENALTIGDVECLQNGVPLPKYHALVLYAKEDNELGKKIIINLESAPHSFKLFCRYRDMLPGMLFELNQLSRLMETRCNKLIILLTNEFLRSPENIFLVNYTQKLQTQYDFRKIVPIVCSEMKIPSALDIYTHLKYNHESTNLNFWERLASSLKL
ncbi:hypothetical protein ACLKA6_001845 [Drosophila palustris]